MTSQHLRVHVPPDVAPPRGAAWAADAVTWLVRTSRPTAHPCVHGAALAVGSGAGAVAVAVGGQLCAAARRLAGHPAVTAARAWPGRAGLAVWRAFEAVGEARARPVLREFAAREAARRRVQEDLGRIGHPAKPEPPATPERTTSVLAATEAAATPRDGAAAGTTPRLDPLPCP